MEIPPETAEEFVKKYSERKCSEKEIEFLPNKDHPQEIVAEMERLPAGESSFAVALIGRSQKHVHHHTRETYNVIKGEIDLYCGGSGCAHRLGPADSPYTILPNVVHWAVAVDEPAVVVVVSVPAWTKEDHHLVEG